MNNKNNTNSMEDEHGNHDNQGQFENKRYSHFSSKNAWASALSTASVTSQANNTQMYPNQNFLMIQPYVLQYGEIYFTPTPYFQTRTPAQIFEGEPFIRLTIVKARDSSLINQQFFIKNTGMLGTRKNTIINDIVIGRNIFYGLTNPNINPLDIAINDQHGFISPIHGKFIFEDAFKNRGYIYPTFLSFLMMSHPRLGYYSPGRNLPRHLYQHIYSFLLPKRALYIQDAGSQSGTFVKIPYSIPFRMSNNSRVLVGLHAEFNIIDMHDSETVGKINRQMNSNSSHVSIQKFQQQGARSVSAPLQSHGLRPPFERSQARGIQQALLALQNQLPQQSRSTQNARELPRRRLLHAPAIHDQQTHGSNGILLHHFQENLRE
eukprot:TRINITY_DN5083_c0_g1_i2.p1 TRINITY_DN5083_c0_g1~~TRINITY_DN5083_c0_g1_i2.p1  ORF type:complete len:377 (+),score=98.13 TRINITY_DN5083_c0_g1_i2:417-1547(+)